MKEITITYRNVKDSKALKKDLVALTEKHDIQSAGIREESLWVKVTYVNEKECYVENENLGQEYLLKDLPKLIKDLPYL